MRQQTAEDYLKTIYLLAETAAPVSTARLSEARGITASSATSMMQRLADRGLVIYRKQVGVTLTGEGKSIALAMVRRHRLLELYLTEELGFGWHEVHEEAERMEHAISERFTERMTTVLGDPGFDPHGEPIPGIDGVMNSVTAHPLSELNPGDSAVIVRISDDKNCDLLRHLAEIGLVPGARLEVLEKPPFDGPLTLQLPDRQQVVGLLVADIVHVTKE